MKKAITIIMALALSLSLFACGNSSTDSSESASGDNKIYMGTEAGFAPYEYMSGDKIVGVDVDISNAIAESLGKELVIKNMDFDGALNAVQHGQIDFVAAAVSVDEERLKVMDFSTNYVDSKIVAVVKKDSEKVKSNADINGAVVGIQQGNTAGNWVEDNCPDSKINLYTKFVQAAEDLKNDKIDAIVMDNLPAQELVAANDSLMILDDEPLSVEQYAIAVNKGNTELLNKINEVIEKLIAAGKIEEFVANHTAK